MIEDRSDLSQAIRPQIFTDIDGLGSSKRQRASEEDNRGRDAEAAVGEQQQPQEAQGGPAPGLIPTEEEIQEEARPARARRYDPNSPLQKSEPHTTSHIVHIAHGAMPAC